VYIMKFNTNYTNNRLKAKLVANGYTQTYGIYYAKIFYPVTKISKFQVLLSLSVNLDWSLQQIDMKNAF